MIGRHEAVDLGRRRHVIFLIQDAAPVEFGQDAIVHTAPAVVLDVEVVGRNELLRGGSEDCADRRDNRLLRPALVAEGKDHEPLGRQMTLVDRVGDMLLHAEEAEIRRGVGMLRRGIPFVGPGHGDGDGISRLDADVHVSTSGCRMVNATGVEAGGLHGDGLGVGRGPIEDAIILRVGGVGEGADEYRGEDRKMLHSKSICRVQVKT